MEHKPTNDRAHPVTKFCLSMEEHRRTPEGRVRTEKDLVAHFFPREGEEATDRLFRHIPNDVRGPVLTAWGIRGSNSARRDGDDKVRTVVNDALLAGDLNEVKFEEGITAALLIDWVALSDWWTFWRKGKLTGVAIRKALATARTLGLIDDKWFFENLEGRNGRLKGTDVVCDTLTKDQVIAWLKNVHASGDGSPAGLVSAIGWDTILQKTAEDALLFALDAFARKTGLVVSDPTPASVETPKVATPKAEPAKLDPTKVTIEEKRVEEKHVEEQHLEEAREETRDEKHGAESPAALEELEASPLTSTAKLQKVVIPVDVTPIEESPKLAEARAAMLKMLNQPGEPPQKVWEESEVPGRPSALEWPDQPLPADVGSVDIIPVTDDESVPVLPVAPPAPPPAKAKSNAPSAAKKAPMPRAR